MIAAVIGSNAPRACMFHPKCSALSRADRVLDEWPTPLVRNRPAFESAACPPDNRNHPARQAIECFWPAVAATHLQFAVRNHRGRVNMRCDVLRLSKHSEQGREFRARGSPRARRRPCTAHRRVRRTPAFGPREHRSGGLACPPAGEGLRDRWACLRTVSE